MYISQKQIFQDNVCAFSKIYLSSYVGFLYLYFTSFSLFLFAGKNNQTNVSFAFFFLLQRMRVKEHNVCVCRLIKNIYV